MFLNFSDLPNHQNLFLDYLYEFENVEKYFRKNVRDKNRYDDTFQNIVSYNRKHKDLLADIIAKQYRDLKLSKQTKTNIESLKSGNTVAILTGQQLGVFGGPLYTFYKTITAIKLAAHLNEQYDKYKFVPVFWLAGDDHDFAEIKSFNIINKNNEFINIEYTDGKPGEFNRGSVGNLKIKKSINETFAELENNLTPTEFTPEVISFLKKSYKAGNSIKSAFSNMLFNLFDEYGLVIFDPQDPEVKKILQPVFEKELLDFRIHTKEIVEVSAELEDVYHAQVKVNPINLFLLEKDGRYLIEPAGNEFRLKSKRKRITENELLERLKNKPEDFSPNVLLRPVCQDYLFPTGFYVGGPSEVSYFAQVVPLYNFYKIPQPFIYPRSSLTIVEKSIKKIIDKYGLEYYDVFIGEDLLTKKIVREISEINILKLFNESKTDIELIFDRIKENFFAIDQNLKPAVTKSKDKIIQLLDNLFQKAEKSQNLKYDDSLRQIRKLQTYLFPDNELQERELNFFYFANKYGLDIMKWIYNEIKINKFAHQILEM